MHCHHRHHSYDSFDNSYGSFGTPEFLILDFSAVTNITTLTQIANAFSIGGGVAAASNVGLVTQ